MLFKNVIRTLRKKWMQLTAIGIIIILSSLTYTMMFYGLSGIEEPTETYLSDYSQEDFSVEFLNMVTESESSNPKVLALLQQGIYSLSDIKRADSALFYTLMNDRKTAFEKVYEDFSLELRESKIVNFEFYPVQADEASADDATGSISSDGSDSPGAADAKSHKALLIKDSERINRSFIEEGRKPSDDGEIALNKIYADKNSIKIGDSLSIGEKSYQITGFVLMPDYTLPMFGYFAYSLVSYLISIPISVVVLKGLMDVFATEYGVVLPLEFKPVHIVIGLLMLILIFFTGTMVSRRKIGKIELQEALKTYGE